MQSIDLNDCDREPIHIPGAVQPHGVLLVVDPASEEIVQAAGDMKGILGHAPPPLSRRVGEVLGLPLEDFVRAAGVELRAEPVYVGSVRLSARDEVDVIAHRRDRVVILELERAPAARLSAAHLLGEMQAIGAALEAAPDLPRTCQTAAHELRRLTGFDRVMVYRFLEDGSGYVLAEDRAAELPSFLNHHYPASDIPKQARELYLRNVIRVIPDVNYMPSPLRPPVCPATARSLDMSNCALRSVSPIHIQYLKNMGVGASMSVSIVRDGVLWGLIACHHRTPMPVPYELRQACKRVGQILSQQIAAREEAEAYTQARRLADARDEFLVTLARAEGPIEGALAEHAPELLAIVPSDGVAVCCGGQVTGAGHRPSDDEVRGLADWLLRDGGAQDPFATDRLSGCHAPALAYRTLASGLLATMVSREEPLVVLWFRAERAQVIEWAGNPHKPAEPGSVLGTLTPRASFELWRETVHGRSRPWTAAEVDAARRFHGVALELGRQRRLEQLNRQLRQALADKEALIAQKDLLMREVHHRVQNSLQLVNSMLRLQEGEATELAVTTRFAEARRRILAVSATHRRLWRSDQIQSVRFDTYLRELRDDLVEEWGSAWDEHFRIRAEPMLVPTDAAVSLALVITELLTNVVKHAYRGVPGPVDVIVAGGPNGSIRIVVADQGGGMERAERPGGFGSRLTRLLVAQVRGEMAFQDNRPGTRVVLTAPLAVAAEGRAASGGGTPPSA
ncbi:histidine kinase [Siccirubricoccus deserti]|uniref:GAF domain-containing protein n=1 Tax=Siccirubricoccus deserti TaxID=2013562 RepID=A0A9X0R1P4_9PROT|nr:histidine kinase dimerization/phosphoacceptor domain -containing protein [Siccirubricoccus deserti]MBC4018081.1 GAF domain-containing protein [Siccirubricoccus deserti]GGC62619.1 histidine kinase [Siccirubricoccus deserti]